MKNPSVEIEASPTRRVSPGSPLLSGGPVPLGGGQSFGDLRWQSGLTTGQKLILRLPARFRMGWFNEIEDPNRLLYYWQVRRLLPGLRPRVVVCYDDYKLGPLLRCGIDWPCRIILSQHGQSYFLNPARASDLYSLRSFDAVYLLTAGAYRFERTRLSTFEPLVSVVPNGVIDHEGENEDRLVIS
jgi:hypothetical protein